MTSDLPAVLAIAWGRTPVPTRGPRAGLHPAAIVEAAIAVGDAEGLAAISMGKVAERLGYTPMSLYRHVPSKDDLLALVQDAVIGDPPPGPPPADWRAALAEWAGAVLLRYREHAWALDIPISGPPAMPRTIAWLEWALTAVADTPLTLDERLSAVLLLSSYSRQWAVLTRDLGQGYLGTDASDDPAGDYQRALEALVDPERFPATHAAIAGGMLTDGAAPPEATGAAAEAEDLEAEFAFGLDRILDGLAVHIARHGA
jgi:AcrR family transcriptional regulator